MRHSHILFKRKGRIGGKSPSNKGQRVMKKGSSCYAFWRGSHKGGKWKGSHKSTRISALGWRGSENRFLANPKKEKKKKRLRIEGGPESSEGLFSPRLLQRRGVGVITRGSKLTKGKESSCSFEWGGGGSRQKGERSRGDRVE